MVPKKERLPISLFPRDSAVIARTEFFWLKLSGNNLGFNRAGVTFKAKSFKSAVIRNKYKRMVLDALKLAGFFGKKGSGKDLLIILNPPMISLSREELIKKLKYYDKFFV